MPEPTALDEHSPAALPCPATEAVIATTVRQLKQAARDGVLATAIAIGQVVVDNIFAGDVAAWRDHGEADLSYRQLVAALEADQDETVRISKAMLSRSVGVYDLEQRLAVSTLKRITASHCYSVLGLSPAEQAELLKRADDEGLSVRELAVQIRASRKKRGERRGRPTLPRFQKSLHRLQKMLDADDEAFGDLDEHHLALLDENKAEELYRTAEGMKARLETLQQALQPLRPGSEG